jgi:hypothetical protein
MADIDLLVDVCEALEAYMQAQVVEIRGRQRLCGVMVLTGSRKYSSTIRTALPNFLIAKLDPFEGVPSTEGMVVMGTHPFSDLKRKLF